MKIIVLMFLTLVQSLPAVENTHEAPGNVIISLSGISPFLNCRQKIGQCGFGYYVMSHYNERKKDFINRARRTPVLSGGGPWVLSTEPALITLLRAALTEIF